MKTRNDLAYPQRSWIGGRLSPSFFVEDRENPYRAELVVWIEESTGLVVGQKVIGPDNAEGALGRVLLAALDKPFTGPKRRPDRIRVADAALAAEVKDAVGDTFPIEVAPTPELDALLEAMLESMPPSGREASYLAGGRISPDLIERLFSAAQLLFRVKPWEFVEDSQVLRLSRCRHRKSTTGPSL